MKRIILYGIFLLAHRSVTAQCSSTAFNNGSSFTTDGVAGVYDFVSPDHAQFSDNSRTSAASLISVLSGNTNYLKVTGFNFGIPSYASICGVTVEIEARATGLLLTAAVRDQDIKLVKNGQPVGNNYAKGGDWGNTDQYNSYGGSTDLWGTTLTPADVNAPDFGVVVSVRLVALVAALPSAQIDHIRMKIDYNPVLPVHIAYFKTAMQGDRCNIEWQTTEEEDGAKIILQRSAKNDWSDLLSYDLSVNNNNKVYRYTDLLTSGEKYAYRLKMVSVTGVVTYSAIRYASVSEAASLSFFPNPGHDIIAVSGMNSNDELKASDMFGREWTLRTERAGNNCRVSVAHLPAGIYMLRAGRQQVRFIRN